jgi:hypothetical protein
VWEEALIHCWWECKLVQPLWKTVWRFLKTLKIKLPYDVAMPLLGNYLNVNQECNPGYNKDICTSMFTEALFTIAKLRKWPRCPKTDEWIKKNVVFIHNGILFSHQKKVSFVVHR